jgi:restriction endonuclease Mrr
MRKRKSIPAADKAPVKEKKLPTEFQIRARKENLKKAQTINAENKRKKDMIALDVRLNNLGGEIDETVEKQVIERLGKLDRKRLKDEVLQVFHDMGGKRAMKKWAKANEGAYYKLMAAILKTESDKVDAGGGGVTVNLFGLESVEVDITPDKP